MHKHRMKKNGKIFSAMAAALAAALMVSCEIETSGNGDLDGMWHLDRVDTLSTGGVADMSDQYIFWAVQLDLLNAVERGDYTMDFYFRFEQTASTLRLHSPHYNNRSEGDPEVTDPDVLRPVGVNALDETFNIERMSNQRMVLSTEELRLTFSKL